MLFLYRISPCLLVYRFYGSHSLLITKTYHSNVNFMQSKQQQLARGNSGFSSLILGCSLKLEIRKTRSMKLIY